MTVPMNNTLSNSSRDRAQHLYNKNVELEGKRRKALQAKIPSDPNAWQQMRENYECILLEDHAFSEQHDIEYALWQLHYKRIEELRAHYSAAQAQISKGPARITKIRSQFKTFLSEATGFYHDLMVKIRAKYGLSLGYNISDDVQNDGDVKKGMMSCHRCFIYLGDLARYKGLYGEGDLKARDFDAASSYYKQAAAIWPSSGNPHHQLAILASYSGDEFLAVYRYFRSLAVDTPFTTARDNLIIAFEKNRQSYCQLLGDTKAAPNKKTPARLPVKGRNKSETWVSSKDKKTESNHNLEKEISMPETLKALSIRFVRLNGILFTRTSLETFPEVFSVARTDFRHLLSSGKDENYNFGSDYSECKLYITRFISIMIFTVHNANKETEHQSYAEILQRSVILQNAFTAIFDFMSLILQRSLHLSNPPSGTFLLPAITIFTEWLACSQDLVVPTEMDDKQKTARSSFWTHLVSFLNKVLSEVVVEDKDETCLVLPEDMELSGFLPLLPAQKVLDFSRSNYSDGSKEKNSRLQRIIAAGKLLSKNVRIGHERFYFDSKVNKFLFGVGPQNSNQLSVNIKQENGELEEEEEDEVILFKPSVPEKFTAPGLMTNVACASSVNENVNVSQVIEKGVSNMDLVGKRTEMPLGNNESLFQDSETVIPSKFDSVMTSATSIPLKTKSVKSPVSRPVRHYGPPPGFNTVAPKYNNEPLFGVNIMNGNGIGNRNGIGNGNGIGNAPVDDYSWLDGYQLPYSGYNNGIGIGNNRIGIGNSFNCLPQPNKLLSTSKSSLGMESFPFPGKQASVIPGDNGNGWVGYHEIPERSSGVVYEEQKVRKGNEEFIAQQYQGQQQQQQSLWEGRFFV